MESNRQTHDGKLFKINVPHIFALKLLFFEKDEIK